MSLKAHLQKEMADALKSGDKQKRGTLQLLMSAIKQKEVDERITLSDEQILAIIDKMIAQRHEASEQFKQGNRADLADKEQAEINVLQTYLPEPLSPAEVEALIKQAMAETNATSVRDMGKVMAYLKPKAQGRTDMKTLSSKIKELLE